VPERWIEDIARRGDADAWSAGNGARYFPGLPIRYRSQWYALQGRAPVLFGLGIHGQHLFVDRARGIVVAKVSSQAMPMDTARIGLTTRAASSILEFVAGAAAD
jgi:CubicO group peptidase (beta-lactamase class C family)